MADILIRGMEMPQDCSVCKLAQHRLFNGTIMCPILGRCVAYYDEGIHFEKYKCPLVPLPAGHGRLIDADALINKLQNLFDKREKDAFFSGDRTVGVTWNDAVNSIIGAPTIVTAEGGTDDG